MQPGPVADCCGRCSNQLFSQLHARVSCKASVLLVEWLSTPLLGCSACRSLICSGWSRPGQAQKNMGGSPATLAESGAACPNTLRSALRTFSFRAPEHPPLVSIPCLCKPSFRNSTLCLEVGLAESFRELHEVQPFAAIPVRPSGSSCHRGSIKYKPRSVEARLEAALDQLCRLDLNMLV